MGTGGDRHGEIYRRTPEHFMHEQIKQLNRNFEKLEEQLAATNNQRYGRSSEKLSVIAGQLTLDNDLQRSVSPDKNALCHETYRRTSPSCKEEKTSGKQGADLKK